MRVWLVITAAALVAIALAGLLLANLPSDLSWIRVVVFAAIVALAGLAALLAKRRAQS